MKYQNKSLFRLFIMGSKSIIVFLIFSDFFDIFGLCSQLELGYIAIPHVIVNGLLVNGGCSTASLLQALIWLIDLMMLWNILWDRCIFSYYYITTKNIFKKFPAGPVTQGQKLWYYIPPVYWMRVLVIKCRFLTNQFYT